LSEAFPENLEHGLDLAWAEFRAGEARQALATLDRLRRLPGPPRDDPRIELATALYTASDADKSLAAVAAAKAKARARGATLLGADIAFAEALAHSNAGNCQKTLELAAGARRQFVAMENWLQVLRTDNLIADCHSENRDEKRALATYQAALATARQIGNRRAELTLLGNAAAELYLLDQRSAARQHFAEALALARELEAPTEIGRNLGNLALDRLDESDPAAAITYAAEAVAICRAACKDDLPAWLSLLGRAQLRSGAVADARRTSTEAVAVGRLDPKPIALLEALDVAIMAHHETDDLAGAARLNDERRAFAVKVNGLHAQASADLSAAGLALESGDFARAAGAAKTALTRTPPGGALAPYQTITARVILARAALGRGDLRGTRREIELARAVAGGPRWMSMAIDLVEARRLGALGRRAAARRLVGGVLEFAQKTRSASLELDARFTQEEIGPRVPRRLQALAAKAKRQGALLWARRALALVRGPSPTALQRQPLAASSPAPRPQ
jgi:tetratricopeptide (TPR) repeat protein